MVLHSAEPHCLFPASIRAAAFAKSRCGDGAEPAQPCANLATKSCGTPNGYPDHGVRGGVNQHLIGD